MRSKSASRSCRNASGTPGKISTSFGSPQYSTSRMIVPSRSRKTARDDLGIEAGDQFVGRNGRGAELADNHRAGVIRNLGGLARRRLATKREGEERNRRIAGAGNIEDLPRLCRDVQRIVGFE